MKKIFEQEKEDYYKPVGIGSFYSNIFIEYESNDERNKTWDMKNSISNGN